MQYELYADSLFLLNLGMNLYLLILVNLCTLRTARPIRLLVGAVWGSLSFLLLFADVLPVVCRVAVGIFAGTAGMLLIAFPVAGIGMFLKLLERLVLFSFCMGGLLLFVGGLFPAAAEGGKTGGILTASGLLFLFLLRTFHRREQREGRCMATLKRDGAGMTVNALIDSGNSLVEPISGKPVSVVDKQIFQALWKDSLCGLRAVPYRSVGKERGIMYGFPLPELLIEVDGVKKEFKDVYIAVWPEASAAGWRMEMTNVKMIINPRLLTGGEKERPNDIEGGNAGKNAVQNDAQGEIPGPKQERRDPLHRGQRGASPAAGAGAGEPGHKRFGNGGGCGGKGDADRAQFETCGIHCQKI